jgi:uncharacterized protein YcbK (DUF882 family)
MGKLGPSKHLTWEELACKDGTPYPEKYIKDGTVELLAAAFEGIRAIWNKPIIVVSAYRTNSWNTKIGGARKSQHKLGRALDLLPPHGISVRTFHETILDFSFWCDIKGIGLYKNFVHIDVRESPRMITWEGKGLKDYNV